MNDRFQPLLRANHVEHHRQMVGIDGLTIIPAHICVCHQGVRNHVNRYSLSGVLMDNTTQAPECDLTAECVRQYLAWSDQTHKASLVDRHQSNGV